VHVAFTLFDPQNVSNVRTGLFFIFVFFETGPPNPYGAPDDKHQQTSDLGPGKIHDIHRPFLFKNTVA